MTPSDRVPLISVRWVQETPVLLRLNQVAQSRSKDEQIKALARRLQRLLRTRAADSR
jgi:hypothetical protein